MNSYNMPFKKCENLDFTLSKILESNENVINHYKYKGINFMYNHNKKSKCLIIAFHGVVKIDMQLPIFRGYNWNFDNCSILSISDHLLEVYRKYGLEIAWYLSSNKYKCFNTYKKIIKKILQINNNNGIFFGTSAGGLPAITFASYFNQKCVISNSQLYIINHPRLSELDAILTKNDDYIINNDIEKIITKFGCPKKLILMCNKNDKFHYIIIKQENCNFTKFYMQNHTKFNHLCKTKDFTILI